MMLVGTQQEAVAIKILPQALVAESQHKLDVELRILKTTSARCIHAARLHGTTSKNGRTCIVMKLYERSLEGVIRMAEGGRLAPMAPLAYARDLFRALAEQHEQNILSGDIKARQWYASGGRLWHLRRPADCCRPFDAVERCLQLHGARDV